MQSAVLMLVQIWPVYKFFAVVCCVQSA